MIGGKQGALGLLLLDQCDFSPVGSTAQTCAALWQSVVFPMIHTPY
jgi:hypothetical protein